MPVGPGRRRLAAWQGPGADGPQRRALPAGLAVRALGCGACATPSPSMRHRPSGPSPHSCAARRRRVRNLGGAVTGGAGRARAGPNRHAEAVEACGGVDKMETLTRWRAPGARCSPRGVSVGCGPRAGRWGRAGRGPDAGCAAGAGHVSSAGWCCAGHAYACCMTLLGHGAIKEWGLHVPPLLKTLFVDCCRLRRRHAAIGDPAAARWMPAPSRPPLPAPPAAFLMHGRKRASRRGRLCRRPRPAPCGPLPGRRQARRAPAALEGTEGVPAAVSDAVPPSWVPFVPRINAVRLCAPS